MQSFYPTHHLLGPSAYAYTSDLLALEACSNPCPPALPDHLCKITTPLKAAAWAKHLAAHPDQIYAQYILRGITYGFRIGFGHGTHLCTRASSNHPSAMEQPAVVSKGLQKEISKGRLIGPLDPASFPYVQISSLGAIPKKHTVDEWRLILDLSHPKAASVNDGIDRGLCSLSYMKVDDVVQQVLLKGRGSMLAKIDIKSAFRNVPVHPADRHLLGMMWKSQLFIDTVLPFGQRSAPKIFNCIADALQWIAKSQGVTYLEHFLDDYITVGAPGSMECDSNLATLISLCTILNLPLAAEKKEGPTTCLAYLGIEVDTERLELRLPAEKLKRLQALLQKWITYKCCKKHDLESLVGYLHDASTIVQPGRTFTRRLIDLLKTARHRAAGSFTRLNTEARSDILWWHSFITDWNGLSMMHQLHKKNPEIILTFDASGSWGCGAFWNTEWFQYQWSAYTADLQITTKELMPVVIAAAIWGPQWSGKSVQCRCDNEAVVSILNSGTSKDPTVMGLMRCLHFFAAKA